MSPIRKRVKQVRQWWAAVIWYQPMSVSEALIKKNFRRSAAIKHCCQIATDIFVPVREKDCNSNLTNVNARDAFKKILLRRRHWFIHVGGG